MIIQSKPLTRKNKNPAAPKRLIEVLLDFFSAPALCSKINVFSEVSN